MKNEKKITEIKLVDVWYLDGNYNPPIKTKGSKQFVQSDKYYTPNDGYIFIYPKTNAFIISTIKGEIFETEKAANDAFIIKIEEHKKFVERQIKEYTEELKKINL